MRLWDFWLRLVWRVTGPAALGIDLLRALLRAAALYVVMVVVLGMAVVTVEVRDTYAATERRLEAAQQTLTELKEKALRLLPGRSEPPAQAAAPTPPQPPIFGLPPLGWLLLETGAAALPLVLAYWWAVALGFAFLDFSRRRAARRFAAPP